MRSGHRPRLACAIRSRAWAASTSARVRCTLRAPRGYASICAASRRRLNRAFAVAGAVSDDDRPRAIVRARLGSGALFPVNGHSWAGYGSGRPCAVCDAPIGRDEIEYEVTGPKGRSFIHLVCFMVWHRESERPCTEPPESDGKNIALSIERYQLG